MAAAFDTAMCAPQVAGSSTHSTSPRQHGWEVEDPTTSTGSKETFVQGVNMCEP